MQKNIYMLPSSLTLEDAIKLFDNELIENPKYVNDYLSSLLSVEVMYIAYYFFDCRVYNQAYFYINKETNERHNGMIDTACILSDGEFILNGLNKKDFIKAEDATYSIYNQKEYDNAYKRLIKSLKAKATATIMNKHNIRDKKSIHVDLAPLEKIDDFILDIYYERVYVFKYHDKERKKEYVSVLSDNKKSFYKFEFIKASDYNEFLLRFKRPIENIPKEYYELYYNYSFKTYLSIQRKLEFEESKELLRKIKSNIDYQEYSQYIDYLHSGIFYYRIKKYLKRLYVDSDDLRTKILFSFLTLKFQHSSGLFLYECAKMNLIEMSDEKSQLSFLQTSYRLGSPEAKRILYDYYNEPIHYNDTLINKYK